MAWLCKRGSRRNYYVALWLPYQKRKKVITTGTTNLKKAEKIFRKVQMLEELNKSQVKALEMLHKKNLDEQGILDDIDGLMETNRTIMLEVADDKFIKSRPC